MRRYQRKHLLLIGACLAVLPILLTRDFTPSNELRYLSIADEALREHHLFAFTNHGIPYADKPPLYLWLVMLVRCLFGSHLMLPLALLSVVPAWLTAHVMDTWTHQETDWESRWKARLMLLTGGLFLGAALTVRMDMLMCLFIVLSMRSFWRIYTNPAARKRERWLFPTFLFLALFTKGPLGILIPLCATVAFLVASRQAKRIPEFWGWRTWGVLVLCCALWWGLTYAEGGAAYLDNLLFHQTVGRAVHAFHHERPFYFYAVCLWYCLVPWTLVVVLSLASSLRQRVLRSPLHNFLSITFLTTLALLSCISGKLQVYMLPAVPFMVYAAAIYLPRAAREKWYKPSLILPACIFAMALPILVIAEYIGAFHPVQLLLRTQVLVYFAAAFLTIGGILALLNTDKAVSHMATGMLVALFIVGLTIPSLNRYIGYAEACKEAESISQRTGIKRIAAWKVKNAADMDVYLRQAPIIVPDEADPNQYFKQPTLLIMHNGAQGDLAVKIVGKNQSGHSQTTNRR